jgi:cysteinyl-tRNA synthetase
MSLKIYNTMKKKKELFTPLNQGKIGIYACGVTVYDLSHIGHARAMVVFDVIQRYLRYCGYDVTYVRNYTDIDDKIINRANEEAVPFNVISERYIKEFDNDMASLYVEIPTHTPRATEHIQDMIRMITVLIEKGKAYEIDGDVYFSVGQFSGYGKLSGKDTESLLSGARVEVNERKKNPLDFALWKKSKEGEPFWESPWGKGRPGWHIECSAMSQKYLGETFDIHCGGMDLIFPHHENEIAQAECSTGKQFARFWMHNGFVNIDKEKMSKSLKNFLTIREVLKDYHPEVIRLFLLSNHYRSPVDFSHQNLVDTKAGLDRLYTTLKDIGSVDSFSENQSGDELEKSAWHEITAFPDKFREAMDDDFNTAAAIGSLFTVTRSLNSLTDKSKKDPSFKFSRDLVLLAQKIFNEAGNVLGLFQESPVSYFENQKKSNLALSSVKEEEIENLIAAREKARKEKNWKKSDEIRDSLAEKGIIIKDTPQGTQWSFKN